jgi:hypothetical protein
MGDGLLYRASKFSRKHLAVLVGVLSVMFLLATALLVRRETVRYAEEAYTRATQVSQGLLPAKLRELARAYQELARIHMDAGETALGDDYAMRSEAAMRHAAAASGEPYSPPDAAGAASPQSGRSMPD